MLTNKGITYEQTDTVTVSGAALEEHRLLGQHSDARVVAAYKMLRTRVLQRIRHHGWNAIAVTSATPGEGKSLTAANLAISLSQEVNHTVLLVDMDLRAPSLHEMFALRPTYGLIDYLEGAAELSSVLINPGIPGLVLLPGGKPVPMSSEVLSTPQMIGLADELKRRYPSRIVLYDVPAAAARDDMLAFAPCVDAYLLVVGEGKATADDIRRVTEIMGATPRLGAVLNRSSSRDAQLEV